MARVTKAIVATMLIGLGVLAMPPVARATMGVGGTISLGSVAGAAVPVNTTAATDAYAGFNIHIRATASAGVTVTSMSGSATGSTIISGGDPSSVSCASSVPAAGELVYACVALNGQSTTAAGLLATLTVSTTGNGYVDVHLVTSPTIDLAHLSTFTVNAPLATVEMQANTVNTNNVHVFAGSGVLADCAAGGAVGGIAEPPDARGAAASTGGSRHWNSAFAAAVLLAIAACGSVGVRRLRRIR
jgi:hypothetical protein